MNWILVLFSLYITLPRVVTLFSSKYILCNQSISDLAIDSSITSLQNLSLTFCNLTFDISLRSNEHFFARNNTIDRSFKSSLKRRSIYLGRLHNDEHSSISLILQPQLQIFLFSNGTYYYYLSLPNNSSVILKFSQRQLLQYYPQLVNDSLWNDLQEEEDIYQKNSLILHDLHFIYEFLTLRCESEKIPSKRTSSSISFCSLALYLDRYLFEQTFHSNIYYLYTIIEHFNFLLRTFTRQQYGGFLLKRLTLFDHIESPFNSTFDLLHTLSNNRTLALKDYCLVHQMLFTNTEQENYVLGYQSSVETYDVGGICSSPFYLNNNQSEEINLNTGLSILHENLTTNLSLFVNGLMKTSYLFFRQMGLNLTLCSINATRRRFFQFNTPLAPIVSNCIDLIPSTLHPALKRRAHLCFNHFNLSNQSMRNPMSCEQSMDLQSSVPIDGKHRKSPYIENALNNNRRGEWFEGNIVGMILTFSLIIWIPVSCFVHFCVDEVKKKSLIEKRQPPPVVQESDISTSKSSLGITKQTQTE